jgi:hypothetical protein
VLVRSAHDVTTNEDAHEGREVRITNYFGQRGQGASGPQVFLVDYPGQEGVAVRPHFHSVDQFQVFFAGSTVGHHVIRPVTVHYADAFTSYGPITDDGSGVTYLTVRAEPDAGPRYMPESRAERKGRGGGRQLTASTAEATSKAPGTYGLVSPHADGLAVSLLRLEPDQDVAARTGESTADRDMAFVVLAGLLVHEGRACPSPSVMWRLAGDVGADGLSAGPGGADVLLLTFRR